MSKIGKVIDLSVIRYSRVWEDWAVLAEGLQINQNDDILSITSAGDNVLNLLLQNPRSITAIDMSPAQNAVLELKIAAIRQFEEHGHFLELIGIKGSSNRLQLYQKLELPHHVKEFWDQRTYILEQGLCSVGKLDSFFDGAQESLPKYVSEKEIDRFLDARDVDQRKVFLELPQGALQEWLSNTLSRKEVVSKSGRDKEQYKYVSNDEEQLMLEIWARLCHVCQEVPVRDNIYLDLFLRSSRVKYEDIMHKLPPYLHEKNFCRLKGLVDKVHVVTESIEEYASKCQPGSISKVNLSDIFEYMSVSDTNRLLDAIISKCRQNSRIAYWNFQTPRSPRDELYDNGTLRHHEQLSQQLHAKDRAFFWGAFRVEEVM